MVSEEGDEEEGYRTGKKEREEGVVYSPWPSATLTPSLLRPSSQAPLPRLLTPISFSGDLRHPAPSLLRTLTLCRQTQTPARPSRAQFEILGAHTIRRRSRSTTRRRPESGTRCHHHIIPDWRGPSNRATVSVLPTPWQPCASMCPKPRASLAPLRIVVRHFVPH